MLTLEEAINDIIKFHDKIMDDVEKGKVSGDVEREGKMAQQALVIRYCLQSLAKAHVVEAVGKTWQVVGRIETIIHIEKNKQDVATISD